MRSSEPFPHFVDDYLAYLYETCPTQATLDGVHAHDDLLEDFSRPAVDAQARALAGFLRRLKEIDDRGLTLAEAAERPMVADDIRARMHDLEEVRAWEKSPQLYADTLASSLASQVMFPYAPATERARRVLSKLRQVPRFLEAARANVTEPPGIFVKVGLETLRGSLTFIDTDLPRAFSSLDDLYLLGDLADASAEATAAISAYIEHLERETASRARGSFRLGKPAFERKLKLDEGVALDADRLLDIAMRELTATQEAFREVAGRLNGGDPLDAWRQAKAQHPPPGGLVEIARGQIDELATFLDRHQIVSRPLGDGSAVQVGPTPGFLRWTVASLWSPGPFEGKPTPAHYYLTDVDPAWTPERQKEYLTDLNEPALWAISMHQVYPGHFLHQQYLRTVPSKVRKSRLLAPASFVEGWAHYGEHMMLEAGFGRRNDAVKLGQLAKALVRLGRFVVSIRLHAEDMSVEQGVRIFRDECFLEDSSARREAERGTFDPLYLVYALGKLMLLKLRDDYQDACEGTDRKYSLKDFHETLLGHGTATVAVHRRLMLGHDHASDLLD